MLTNKHDILRSALGYKSVEKWYEEKPEMVIQALDEGVITACFKFIESQDSTFELNVLKDRIVDEASKIKAEDIAFKPALGAVKKLLLRASVSLTISDLNTKSKRYQEVMAVIPVDMNMTGEAAVKVDATQEPKAPKRDYSKKGKKNARACNSAKTRMIGLKSKVNEVAVSASVSQEESYANVVTSAQVGVEDSVAVETKFPDSHTESNSIEDELIASVDPKHLPNWFTNPDSIPNPKGVTKKDCMATAASFESMTAWKKAYPKVYEIAVDMSWVDECTSHMTPSVKWTKRSIYISALRFKKISEWRKHFNRAATTSKNLGIYDDCIAHMEETISTKVTTELDSKPNKAKLPEYGKLTKKNCLEAARKCNTPSEFRDTCRAAYLFAEKKGWLNECKDATQNSTKSKKDKVMKSLESYSDFDAWRKGEPKLYGKAKYFEMIPKCKAFFESDK